MIFWRVLFRIAKLKNMANEYQLAYCKDLEYRLKYGSS